MKNIKNYKLFCESLVNKILLKRDTYLEGFDNLQDAIDRSKEITDEILYLGKLSEIPERKANEFTRSGRNNICNFAGGGWYNYQDNIGLRYPFNTSKESLESACNKEYCLIYKTKDNSDIKLESHNNLELRYHPKQQRLFDLDLTDEDKKKYNGKYSDAINYLISEYGEDSQDEFNDLFSYSEITDKFNYTEDESFEIVSEFERIMKDKWDNEDKSKDLKIENAKNIVMEYGKSENLDTTFTDNGFSGHFNDESLNSLYLYLIEDDGPINIDDAAYVTGLDTHELEIMKINL